MPTEPLISNPIGVALVLLGILYTLFQVNTTPVGSKVFKTIPLLVFCYFIPTLFSNLGIIPIASSFSLYQFIKKWVLPASLALLVTAVDIPSIKKLGPSALTLFLVGSLSIIFGGPLAYLTFGWLLPSSLGAEAWKGLAALSGSWLGGGANFIAIGSSVGASENIISFMVVVDVIIANTWMACLLWAAENEIELDKKVGADRSTLDDVQERLNHVHQASNRPTTREDCFLLGLIAIGLPAIGHYFSPKINTFFKEQQLELFTMFGEFTWTIAITTTLALLLSFTPARNLSGAGSTALGSALLYLLITSIGAKADFSSLWNPDNLGFIIVGAAWMVFHALALITAQRVFKAPTFFLAVGSQANVGGAASAPIVASAFHPALAPVGVLLAILGYVVGVYGGLLSSILLKLVYTTLYACSLPMLM